eukprot:TRINITY_DN74793_c0_g1_i1.p1 TRINITY_DN74793_c0_g1~~TRINITY_DN74793_c0_g1_i1.p1  ORF type:complete len:426 (-),score=12.60 TRINITY_DN74793_c0_g1_i1:38-1315(-)
MRLPTIFFFLFCISLTVQFSLSTEYDISSGWCSEYPKCSNATDCLTHGSALPFKGCPFCVNPGFCEDISQDMACDTITQCTHDSDCGKQSLTCNKCATAENFLEVKACKTNVVCGNPCHNNTDCLSTTYNSGTGENIAISVCPACLGGTCHPVQTCGQRCTTRHGQCGGNCPYCVSGKCSSQLCGAPCLTDSECYFVQYPQGPVVPCSHCSNGKCSMKQLCGGQCHTDYDCNDQGNCTLCIKGQCHPYGKCNGACRTNADCAYWEDDCAWCMHGKCTPGNCGAKCSTNFDCVAYSNYPQGCSVCGIHGKCTKPADRCGARCDQDVDCNPNQKCSACVDGKCSRGVGCGQACSYNQHCNQCGSCTDCVNGKCGTYKCTGEGPNCSWLQCGSIPLGKPCVCSGNSIVKCVHVGKPSYCTGSAMNFTL